MTARDLDLAWRIVDSCARDNRGFRLAVAEEIAALLAELRRAKARKRK